MAVKAFTENFDLEGSRVLEQESKIDNVKILGSLSKNLRKYSSKALDSLVRMSEGIRVVCDHSANQFGSSVKDLIGTFEGVYRDGDSVFGTLKVLKESFVGPLLFELASSASNLCGMSIEAKGVFDGKDSSGNEIVKDMQELRQVSLVLNPATTAGLYEKIDDSRKEEIEMLRKENLQMKEKIEDHEDRLSDVEGRLEEMEQIPEGQRMSDEMARSILYETEFKEKKQKTKSLSDADARKKIHEWLEPGNKRIYEDNIIS